MFAKVCLDVELLNQLNLRRGVMRILQWIFWCGLLLACGGLAMSIIIFPSWEAALWFLMFAGGFLMAVVSQRLTWHKQRRIIEEEIRGSRSWWERILRKRSSGN